MKEIISTYMYDSFYPENEVPYKCISTRNILFKITNGEHIGAYGDLYVIQQEEYAMDCELIGLSMVQSYDSMKIKKYFDHINKNRDTIDLEFLQ